jgi:hypothetical protein
MNFFNSLISSYPVEYSAYLDDVQDIPVPFRLLYCLYSKPHIQQPRNVGPNTAFQGKEILVEEVERSYPSTFLLDHSRLWMEDIQHAYEHDPYLLLPLVSEHSQHYKFEQPNHDIEAEHHPLIHDNDTSSPKLYEHSNDLQNVNYAYILPCCKSKKILETKVAAINCRVLTDFKIINFA